MSDVIAECGVVGAGGAGFPTSVKMNSKAEVFLVNAAECEPLLHKDKELLIHRAQDMFKGLRLCMERVGAKKGIIGVKGKYEAVIHALEPQLPSGVEILPLTDTYPAGDEFILVYDATGRVIPPGGLPLDVGAVVCNVETLVNVGSGQPVTHKYLTVAGAVENPITLRIPVGTSIREVIAAASGATVPQFEVLMGGTMMGKLAPNLDEPVTKTTGGLFVLPSQHPLIGRYRREWIHVDRIGKSACDQCNFCTELCPRYLLGHPIEPHKAMRALGFAPEKDRMISGTLYCCECNLCSMISCPEDLDPKDVCAHDKSIARDRKLGWTGIAEDIHPHPLFPDRRTPIRRLINKLGLAGFRNIGPLVDVPLIPKSVAIPLKQHTGAACTPTVKVGEKVLEGDRIGAPPEGKLGANIHASISGRVQRVDGSVVIEA